MRLMIIDTHILFRERFTQFLAKQGALEIIDTDPEIDYFRQIVHYNPELVIMDSEFFEYTGKEIIRCVLSFRAQTAFLILETDKGHNLSIDAIIAGARGYLVSTIPLSGLMDALETITRGETVFPGFRTSQLVGNVHA